jgi:peptidoglycan/xylan/chitin deacetylase (PgdA/CDA1 family)
MVLDRLLASALGRRSLLILTYHGVHPDEVESPSINLQGKHVSQSAFAEQIDYLAKAGHRFLSGEELRWVVQRHRLPNGPAVVITFDDGYANNCTAALPILRARGLTAVVFVVGAFIAEREPLWVDRLEQAFMETTSDEITIDVGSGARRLSLANLRERRRAEALVRARCKRLLPVDRARVVNDLVSRLEPLPCCMPGLYDPLSWSQIAELRESGWEIGSHTMTHTVLAGLPTHVARQEVGDAKKLIEDRLEAPCDLFAYPNGLRGDFTPATQRLLADLGKICALASIEGRVNTGFDPFAMQRVSVNDRMGLGELRLRATGAVGVAKRAKASLKRAMTRPAT